MREVRQNDYDGLNTDRSKTESVVVLFGQIFYALQVFGKFIKRACSEINWR